VHISKKIRITNSTLVHFIRPLCTPKWCTSL